MNLRALLLAGVLAAVVVPANAAATTYQVGPGRPYTQPSQVAGLLNPGDEVLIDGDATYSSALFSRNGTAGQPIAIRGIRVNGRLPLISGGVNTVELAGDHYLVEGLELSGGSSRCLYHHADEITVRGSVIHDCPAHGLLGADNDSGSLTLQYVEIYDCGSGTFQHCVYMATDELAHPGSVFRMEHSYIHDTNGGNAVKSRAERNEIYYNWIEGGTYHELELIGPDPAGGVGEGVAREDSDVVGNVLYKRNSFSVTRVGGDATGQTYGRYRFAFNTIVTQPGGGAVFRVFDGIDGIEADGNILYAAGGGTVNVMREVEADWASGTRTFAGQNNWVKTGAANLPPEWTGTIRGSDPGFADFANLDLRPTALAPVVDHAPASPLSPPGHPFPNPLFPPTLHPPLHSPVPVGGAAARPSVGPLDIGAFEFGVSAVPPPGGGGDGGGDDGGTGDPTDPAVRCRGRTATIVGTRGPDRIRGTSGPDVIVALAGNDDVRSLAGADLVCGGSGNDELRGGTGNDRLLGEGGADALRGGGGDEDRCGGGLGRDHGAPSCERRS